MHATPLVLRLRGPVAPALVRQGQGQMIRWVSASGCEQRALVGWRCVIGRVDVQVGVLASGRAAVV